MNYYPLDFFGLKRDLPIINLAPKIKIASLSLLGDVELTHLAAEKLADKLKKFDFDYLVGPEVKVVPLLFALSQILGKTRFVVCRKSIKGYMISPKVIDIPPEKNNRLVLDGPDHLLIKDKKIAIIDDVVSSGTTITNLEKLLSRTGAKIVVTASVFKQGNRYSGPLVYLQDLPVFTT
jgi:adenine phosphoribosyltransferase